MIYDGLILLILVLAAWRGAARGLAWQVAWIGGIVLCFLFATPLSLFVTPHIRLDPPLNRWVAMLVIYMAFSFGCFAIARTLRGWLEEARFQEFDKHLGAILGLAKGVAIAFVLTFFLLGLSETARAYILKTNSGYAAAAIFRKLHPIMPREIEHVLERYDHFGIPVSHDEPPEHNRPDFDNGTHFFDRHDDNHSPADANRSDPDWNRSPQTRPPFGRAGYRPISQPDHRKPEQPAQPPNDDLRVTGRGR
jgi:membrane protein required for colicin V production